MGMKWKGKLPVVQVTSQSVGSRISRTGPARTWHVLKALQAIPTAENIAPEVTDGQLTSNYPNS